MDTGPSRASGIPRFSKLQIPRANRTLNGTGGSPSKDPHKVAPELGTLGLSVRSQRSSDYGLFNPPLLENTQYHAPKPSETALNTNDGSKEARVSKQSQNADTHDVLSSECPNRSVQADGVQKTARPGIKRKPRPSLSDRTFETLSQIPPSPSPQRRKSVFFTNESPMRPSSRPTSVINISRPGSRTGLAMLNTSSQRPTSPLKSSSPNKIGPPSSIMGKRAVSSYTSKYKSGLDRSVPENQTNSRLQRPTASQFGLPPIKQQQPLRGSNTVAPRATNKRIAVQGLFSEVPPDLSSAGIVSASGHRSKPSSELRVNKNAARNAIALEKTSGNDANSNLVAQSDSQTPSGGKVSASSQKLRETIAAAKAARRKSSFGKPITSNVPRSVDAEPMAMITPEIDPFSLDLTESSHTNMLRKRINTARSDGKLNIAGLGLAEIPLEVLRMYDPDAGDNGNLSWFEQVDFIRLIAADNEIIELKDEAFPDVSLDSVDQDDDSFRHAVFGGLELMDMHGNCLQALPLGLRRLSRLTTLNLSRNKLGNGALEVISEITSLKTLRLAENSLAGLLTERICDLIDLEVLDINDNAVTALPSGMNMLSKLRILHVSGNGLTTLPLEALSQISLVELVVSKNRLSGTFFPAVAIEFNSLVTLDISTNSLISVAESDVQLPALQTIHLSSNRIHALPDMAAWSHLSTLIANDNQIRTIPDSFTSLKDLKLVDLSGNRILILDDAIGTMDQLVSLRIDNNPLRERKLLRMNGEDLKLALRNRSNSIQSVSLAASSAGDPLSPTFSPTFSPLNSTTWSVTSGVLDLSANKLRSIDLADLEPVAASAEIRSLVLHHNLFQHISPAIACIGHCLTSLDLTHNKLGQNEAYLSAALHLPQLQTLNLTSNALTSLTPLATHLSAPRLATLILSFNRLTRLPHLCAAFPALSTFLASNNAIVELDVESVRGLRVLDVSGNEIDHLPPRLALLRGQLKSLMVGGNRFRVPGWGVLEKGTEEVLGWCRTRIPVGEEGAGDVD